MLKCIGIVFIIASCTAMGWMKGVELSRRIHQLKEIEKLLYLLLGEIIYRKEALPEALIRVSKKTEEPFHEFLEEVSKHAVMFQGKAFACIFREKTKEYLKKSDLTAKELEEFEQLGEHLGWLDVDLQKQTISLYLERLKEEIQILSGELPAKRKLYQSLGICMGVFLAILLI